MSKFLDLLASLKLALVVLLLLAAACIIGTLLPQGGSVTKYLEANPDAYDRMELLASMGLTNVFYCWWFVLLLCLLSASLSICTFRRFRAALRRKSGLRWKDVGSLFTHVSLLFILLGGVARAVWGQKGYLPLREGQITNEFQLGKSLAKLPFQVRLERFDIEFYGDDAGKDPEVVSEEVSASDRNNNVVAKFSADMGAEKFVGPVKLKVLKKVSDFALLETGEVVSKSEKMINPALQLEVVYGSTTNRQWLFALYPGFSNMHGREAVQQNHDLNFQYTVYIEDKGSPSVKDYKSTLVLLENGVEVKRKTIEVNLPLSYKGYTFYQSGFNPDDHQWTSLQVVKDPGVPLVYTGFVLMIVGLVMLFYINPQLSINSSSEQGKD